METVNIKKMHTYRLFTFLIPIVLIVMVMSCKSKSSTPDSTQEDRIQVIEMDDKVDVLIDGKLFTSYIYPEMIKKPSLWPINTAGDHPITRGFPLAAVAGERADHPHHVGLWLNYGYVNGLDFWNNSEAISKEKLDKYGYIQHVGVLETSSGNENGTLKVKAHWLNQKGEVLIEEVTTYTFRGGDNERSIDRASTLSAVNGDVSFKDNKEGFLGLRVTRSLEHPSDKAEIFTDASGKPTDVPVLNNEGVTGRYYNSEGVEGTDCWGKRADWVNLFGKVQDEPVNIIILDHPKNVGYPTYWHARGYGLFAANPLGQAVFSKGSEILDYNLPKGESVTFNYRVLLISGERKNTEDINKRFTEFAQNQ
jgi:hypothetical protein